MLEKLKEKVIKEKEEQLQKNVKAIYEDFNEYLQRYYLTNLRIEQLKNGDITIEQAKAIANKKAVKENKKEIENIMKKIEEVEKAEDCNYISIIVEWNKSRIWRNESNGKSIL